MLRSFLGLTPQAKYLSRLHALGPHTKINRCAQRSKHNRPMPFFVKRAISVFRVSNDSAYDGVAR